MYFVIAVILFQIFTTNIHRSVAVNQHMVCKTVENVLEDGLQSANSQPASSPERTCRKGRQGDKGDKGDPGNADVDSINNIIDERFNTAIRNLEERLGSLEMKLAEEESVSGPCSDRDGFIYKGKCYYMVLFGTAVVKSYMADRLCNATGGKFAYLVDVKHQDLAEQFLRARLTSQGYSFIWVANTYSTSEMLLFSPQPSRNVTLLRWREDHPSTKYDTGVQLIAASDASSQQNGIYVRNAHSSFTLGVICESE